VSVEKIRRIVRLSEALTIVPIPISHQLEHFMQTEAGGLFAANSRICGALFHLECPDIAISKQNRAKFEECFELLRRLCEDVRIQLSLSHEPMTAEIASNNYVKRVEEHPFLETDNNGQYLAWYAKYTANYFKIVQRNGYFSRSRCKMVLSVNTSSDSNDQKLQAKLVKKITQVLPLLEEWGIHPKMETEFSQANLLFPIFQSDIAPEKDIQPIVETNGFIIANGIYATTFSICAQRKQTSKPSWIEHLIRSEIPFTLSTSNTNIGRGTLELLTIYSADKELLKEFCAETREALDFGSWDMHPCESEQLSAWLANMPTGLGDFDDKGESCANLRSTCCPLYTTSSGLNSGFWFGKNVNSNESVLLLPELLKRLVLVGEGTEINLLNRLLLLRFLCTHVVLWIGTQESISTISDVLGGNAIELLRPSTLLTIIPENSLEEDEQHSTIKTFLKANSGKNMAVFFENELKAKHLRHWATLVQACTEYSANIVVQATKRNHTVASALLDNSCAQFFCIKEWEENTKPMADSESISCLLKIGTKTALTEVMIHPLDQWLISNDSHSKAVIERARIKVKQEAPELCATDIARQAIYQLVMDGIRPSLG